MKRKGLFAGLALALGMVVSFAGGVSYQKANAVGYKDEYENLPEADDIPGDSYFTNAWYHDVGTRRIDKRALISISQADWGRRGKFIKKYDIKSFSITLDVQGMLKGSCMLMTFAKTEGGYVSEEGKVAEIPIEAVDGDKIVNTIGCGDSFAAGFVQAHCLGKSLSECVVSGHHTAALNAQTICPGSLV
jgi:hypothetical protein